MITLATILFLFFVGPGIFWILSILELGLAWIFKGTRFGKICYISYKVCGYIVIAASVIDILVGLVTVVVYICRWLMEAINNGYVS